MKHHAVQPQVYRTAFADCVVAVAVQVFLLPAMVLAQQPTYGIFENREQYYQFMVDVKAEGANNPELMAMVPMINDIVLGQPIGSTGKRYNATSSTWGMLADESVRRELEMVDEQFADLQKSNELIQKRMAEKLSRLDLSDMTSAAQQILAIRDEAEKELQGTLLPHQMRRLRQLMTRNQLRRKSLMEILTSEPWRSQLEISDEQATVLREQEAEIAEELEREIAKLREKARRRLIEKLNARQREQVGELLGEAFDFPVPDKRGGRKK